jgi:hypothetical protein
MNLKNLVGRCGSLGQVPYWHWHGGIEEEHEGPQDIWHPAHDLNQAPKNTSLDHYTAHICSHKIWICLGLIQRTKSGEVKLNMCNFEHNKHAT